MKLQTSHITTIYVLLILGFSLTLFRCGQAIFITDLPGGGSTNNTIVDPTASNRPFPYSNTFFRATVQDQFLTLFGCQQLCHGPNSGLTVIFAEPQSGVDSAETDQNLISNINAIWKATNKQIASVSASQILRVHRGGYTYSTGAPDDKDSCQNLTTGELGKTQQDCQTSYSMLEEILAKAVECINDANCLDAQHGGTDPWELCEKYPPCLRPAGY